MAIYKNHSRKLEQHTHCHSFFRPFSLLTHCLTMCVTYLRPWMMSPHCERGRKMRMHRPVNWNPQTPPPPPPHPPAGMTGAFTFYASKSRWILCSPGPTEWKAFDLLYKMRYILWVVALLGACDVTNNGRHLGFYQELEIRLKPREMVFFCAWHEK